MAEISATGLDISRRVGICRATLDPKHRVLDHVLDRASLSAHIPRLNGLLANFHNFSP
jgi:hypothetical protein